MSRSIALFCLGVVFMAGTSSAYGQGLGSFTIGLGSGPSVVAKDITQSTMEIGTRLSAGAWITPSVEIVLAYDRHGFSDEAPGEGDITANPDGGPNIVIREPKVSRTDFVTLGMQLFLLRSIYVRPEIGLAWSHFADYEVGQGGEVVDALVAKDRGRALGFAGGYRLLVGKRFALAGEVFMRSGSGPTTSPRGAIGVDLALQVNFSL